MGDAIQHMVDLREESKLKRASNRIHGLQRLQEEGIGIESINNNGSHIVVKHNGLTIDYWPGTGLFIVRNDGGLQRRGIRNLVKLVNRHKPPPAPPEPRTPEPPQGCSGCFRTDCNGQCWGDDMMGASS